MPGSRIAKLLVVALLALAGAEAGAAPRCLRYGPEVTLTGTLKEKAFPGEEGDWLEKGWYLHLAKPICVQRASRNAKVRIAENDVAVVQLVIYDRQDWRRWRPLLGREVRIKGKLLHAQAADAHTPLLIEATSVDAVRRRRR